MYVYASTYVEKSVGGGTQILSDFVFSSESFAQLSKGKYHLRPDNFPEAVNSQLGKDFVSYNCL